MIIKHILQKPITCLGFKRFLDGAKLETTHMLIESVTNREPFKEWRMYKLA